MQALFEVLTGAERYRVENLDTKGVSYADTREEAFRFVRYHVSRCGAKNVRVEDTRTGEITEYHLA
jgi:hypothetical protein